MRQDYDMHEAVSDIWLVVDRKRYLNKDNKGSDQAWDNRLAINAAREVRDRNAEEPLVRWSSFAPWYCT